MNRTGPLAFLAAAVALAAPAIAGASTIVDLTEVADALRESPVYVDADAERALSGAEVESLVDRIGATDTPIYVAVLPAAAADVAGGDADEVVSQLADALERRGTYAVVVGESLRAGSTELPAGEAAALAREALDAEGDDTAAVLEDFVDRVGEAAAGESGDSSGTEAAVDDGDGGTNWVLPVILVGGASAAGLWFWRSRQRQQAERARADESERQLLRAELSVLADDVVRLEPEVQLHPEARNDFDAAVNRYRAAQAAVDYIDQPVDLLRVGRVVAEARYLMDRTRAVIEGRDPPPPPADLQRPGAHGEPALTLDDDRQPAYVGHPGMFGGGWFGGANGLFSGLLLGSLLTGGFGGWGGGTTIINNDGGSDSGGDSGGGGDFGGGGFGDFGGGDFGGGDFGGGDFGGGDF